MKCVMCAKETDYFTKNKVCKECDKIYFGEEESSDFQSGGNLMIKCPVCQTENTEEALFCKKCGVKMSSAIEAARRLKMEELRACMLCMSCGAENVNNSTYCIKCGSLLVTPERQVISSQNAVSASTIECPYCHQLNPANHSFCVNCEKNMKYGAVNQKLTGIGGWLYFPVTELWATAILSPILVAVQMSLASATDSYILLWYVFISLLFWILAIIALVLLYRKKKIFPKVMVGIYIASFILTFIEFIVSYLLAIPDVGSGFFRSIIELAIWVPYFLISRRVKNTFVN